MTQTILMMDPMVIATFLGAAFILYLTPGADMMFTIASGLSGGPRAGLAAACGISAGVLTHVLLAAGGLAVLVAANPALLTIIRYLGAAYLGWLAWHSWRHAGAPDPRQGRAHPWQAMKRGYVTNILNPKVGLFVLAFLPQFTDPAAGPVWHQVLWLGLLLTTGGLITDGAIGLFAGLMATRIRRHATTLNRISAVIFGGLALRLAIN